jgi:hypothetical protein
MHGITNEILRETRVASERLARELRRDLADLVADREHFLSNADREAGAQLTRAALEAAERLRDAVDSTERNQHDE